MSFISFTARHCRLDTQELMIFNLKANSGPRANARREKAQGRLVPIAKPARLPHRCVAGASPGRRVSL